VHVIINRKLKRIYAMATTKLKGNIVHLDGTFATIEQVAPVLKLVKQDLSEFTLDE
jgi:hypothetical protein